MRRTGIQRRTLCAAILSWLYLVSGCASDANTLPLAAPFDQEAIIGSVAVVWRNTGDERSFAGGTRLAEPEVRFQYRADVVNRMQDRIFVRLGEFQLTDADGLAIGKDTTSIECSTGSGRVEGALAGEVWVPKPMAARVTGFAIARVAVPLSERGRALYREWLLAGRADRAPQVDAEIARYLAAPLCGAPDGPRSQ